MTDPPRNDRPDASNADQGPVTSTAITAVHADRYAAVDALMLHRHPGRWTVGSIERGTRRCAHIASSPMSTSERTFDGSSWKKYIFHGDGKKRSTSSPRITDARNTSNVWLKRDLAGKVTKI